MKRAALAWCLCLLAFAAGVLTTAIASGNRARGDELDRLERWCEAQSRQNELQRVANQRDEWLLAGAADARVPGRAASEVTP